MAERERVKKAIEAPVAEAAKLLDESRESDVETRLAMLIDGWGRGLAAALEELAIAMSELRRAPAGEETSSPAETPQPPAAAEETEPRRDDEPRTEDELRAAAARSREATAELREQGADRP
jgi:hypothetical protein